ncbi:Glycosyl transferase, group 1 [Alloactinosynnema sp. L-07]|uniref:glycosyltransferase family 4 protein n=1 Tax=Alloactinosynnema sp. L-07 TaxID=1653480 RepID=UPI00065EFD92|nr:glycosyltransferase family 4 protein [Alloactinosynnema sp. L-07]CRK55062.1 Glycosyl transferase, group 1 [Alloactinosynnema sp. L-07]
MGRLHALAVIHIVVPGGIDDPVTPSGGNVYDRRMCAGLVDLGIPVHEISVPGTWPRPDQTARALLAKALADCPDGAVVLLDGLVACGVPEVVLPHAGRLRLAVLVHLPLADETGLTPADAAKLDAREGEVLRAARLVVATGPSTASRLVQHHELSRVRTVVPGTDPAPVAPGTDGASRLLCVASVTPRKGHDVLVEALATLTDLPWHCECVGPLPDTAHVKRVESLIERHGLGARIQFTGPLVGEPLADAYAAADLFVLPSRAETFGMVVTEALARGVPVLASGVPDALGQGGTLLPPGDPDALATALRNWLSDSALRQRARAAALRRRDELSTWDQSVRDLAEALSSLRQ